jgi:hypothetical protein
LKKSRVSQLHGRPYPVQFRNQGAFDAWRQALGSGAEWVRWADPEATCWSIRQEIQQQLNNMRAGKHDSVEAEARAQIDARMQAVSISANLKSGSRYGERAVDPDVLQAHVRGGELRGQGVPLHGTSAGTQRIAGLGFKKRARLLQRAESLYNGIRVGPADLPQENAAHESGSTVAPHWRREKRAQN